MRSFPSAPWLRRALDRRPLRARPQRLAAAVVAVLTVAGLAVPLAQADDRDDLKSKQHQVDGQISNVKGEIHEASAKVAKIEKRLRKATTNLATARDRLATVRADLATAQAAAATLANQLADAEGKLVVAKQALEQARVDVAIQREASRATIISISTTGDPRLALLTSYANAGDIEDVLMGKTTDQIVTGLQNDALNRLNAAETAMQTQRAEVKAARDGVAAAKKAADDNVTAISGLVAQAAAAKDQISGLITHAKGIRQEVIAARAEDRAALKRLEKREARIKQKIIELSQKEHGSYNGATSGLLARPGPGRITSPYGYRVHPIYGYWGLHNGTDFGTGCNAALWAGAAGTVINEYYDEIYGNRLYLAIGKVNGNDVVLVYNHLAKYAVGEGAKVKRGQVVGYSGSTGWSTGCHLHFIVMVNGDTVDPMTYL